MQEEEKDPRFHEDNEDRPDHPDLPQGGADEEIAEEALDARKDEAAEVSGEEAQPGPEGGGAARRESAAAAATRIRQEREERSQKEEQERKLSLHARIQRLDVGERAKLARGGDKDARSILIKDSNKQVAMSVLSNPKITVQEIEMIAASRNVHEEILREIGNNKDWCKSYAVILALVYNPKTPVPIGLTHLGKLLTRDLRFLGKSKGVPEVIRTTAKRHADKRKF